MFDLSNPVFVGVLAQLSAPASGGGTLDMLYEEIGTTANITSTSFLDTLTMTVDVADGYYLLLFSSMCRENTGGGSFIEAELLLDSTQLAYTYRHLGSSADSTAFGGACMVELNGEHTIKLRHKSAAGQSITIYSPSLTLLAEGA